MKFCPSCDIRLKKASDSTTLSCPKCDYTEGNDTYHEEQKISEEPQSDFMVLDAVSYTHLTLPTNREV